MATSSVYVMQHDIPLSVQREGGRIRIKAGQQWFTLSHAETQQLIAELIAELQRELASVEAEARGAAA